MSSQSHNWWLLVLVAAASVVTAAGFGRRSLHSWTRHKWERQCQAQLAALSEQRAARLVQQLADADGEGLAAVVAACGDPRQAVAP